MDIETTGLSPEWDDIIEIGAIRYSNDVEVDRFQSLVQPEPYADGTFVDDFIVGLIIPKKVQKYNPLPKG